MKGREGEGPEGEVEREGGREGERDRGREGVCGEEARVGERKRGKGGERVSEGGSLRERGRADKPSVDRADRRTDSDGRPGAGGLTDWL